MGLRESKKQKTRAAISLLATKLFIERGYDAVTTAEIAELAEVSVPTLFKYFPTKESLVFDEDSEREKFLVETVQNCRKDQTILDALLEAGLKELDTIQKLYTKETKAFMKLIRTTPQLAHYAQQLWLRHEKSLATAIQKESKRKISDVEAHAVARFVLDAFHRSIEQTDPQSALKSLFKMLRDGWR
ncbi:MAG: TetR family transcriptional regulator [Bdellovibrionaceae bacterium]|nr:TetR family transcriptional regulator [Pseudobdellovibrionaceae bacterium]